VNFQAKAPTLLKKAPKLLKRVPRRSLVPRSWLDWVLAIGCGALIVLAIASIGGSSTGSAATQRTATVSQGVVQSTVSGNGSLEAAQQAELNFGASGEVTAIYVKPGEKVSKGQVLARIDASSARASLASAQAKLYEAEEALESAEEAEEAEAEAEETSASYEGGATAVLLVDMSKEGALENGAESKTTPEAESKTTPEAEAKEKAAEEKEKAAEEESGSKNSAGGESEKGEANSGEAGAAEKTEAPAGEKTETPAAGAGAAPAAEPTEGAAESSAGASAGGSSATGAAGGEEGAAVGASVSVPTAEANLREAQLSVKSARQEVRETTLRAPISGTIASVSGAVGENVSGEASSGAVSGGTSESSSTGAFGATGGESTTSSSGSSSSSAFIVLAQLHRLKMEVSFSESDIGKVKVGQAATISIDSLEGTELAGQVTNVSLLPSEGSTSVVEYPATILLTQSAKGLRAGMSASAEVVVEQVKNALSVSSEAITTGPSKTVTVEENGKEVKKTVTTGLVGNEATQIVSGLKAGETVVLPEAQVATATGGTEGATGATGFPGAAGGFPTGGGGFPAGGFGAFKGG
jgi:multidrug efflux pump subunit AcrA (membrane-fusion protein)